MTAGGESPAQSERLRLADLLLEVGPDAPTLCEGWTAADLAAHLVVRESQPLALPGTVLGGAARVFTARRMAQLKQRYPYETLVGRVREGPPLLPMGLPWLRDRVNLFEFFVHHEDVRRAGGRPPRRDEHDLDEAMWRLLGRAAPLLLLGRRGRGVELVHADGRRIAPRGGRVRVRLLGRPGELVLYLYGRRKVAEVERRSGEPGPPAEQEH